MAQRCVGFVERASILWRVLRPRRAGAVSSSRQVAATAREEGGAFLEPRFSIYGRSRDEWAQFARWVRRWRVDAIPGVLLAVQVGGGAVRFGF